MKRALPATIVLLSALALPPGAGSQEFPPCSQSSSEMMTLGKVERNPHKGTAVLPLHITLAGDLFFGGEHTRNTHVATTGVTDLRMKVVARGASRRLLNRKGHTRVLVDVVFLPNCDGDAIRSPKITLVKK